MAYYAFHDINMVSLFKGDYGLIGFTNFERGAHLRPLLHGSVVHLAQYLFFGAVLQVVIGTALALILHHCVRNNAARLVILVILVMPMMPAALDRGRAVALPLQPVTTGAINQALLDIGLIKAHIEWFEIGHLALDHHHRRHLGVDVAALPDRVQRAARPAALHLRGGAVDGASPFLTLRRITLPMLKEVIAIAFIIRFMDAYKFVDRST